MKPKKNSGFLPFILCSLATANAADITRSNTADNLNVTTAWDGGVAPAAADIATWGASSTLSNTMGANNTWGGLNLTAASGAVSISGANNLILDNSTDANTVLNTGTGDFTWGAASTAGNFHINGAAGSTSSTSTGATFSGSGTVTISSGNVGNNLAIKNWSTNGTTNGVTNVTFTGTLALRGSTIPAIGSLSNNWLALGGGGGAASNAGTTTQTGSFALDTGDSTSCGSFILTQGWSGQFLKLNRLQGTGSIRADWGLSAGTQTRGIELDQSVDTTLSGSILANNGSSQRRNISIVKKGSGTLTLTGALGTSGGVASLNFDIQAGAIQLGDGSTNPVYQNAASWDSASTFVVGSGATLRFKTSSPFTWSRALTGGSGTVEITTDGDPSDGAVAFSANNSAFSGSINLNAGSLRMGPNLGSGTLTVKSGTFIAPGLAATNGTSVVGGLTLEDSTESDFRLGVTSDRIEVTATGGLTVPGTGQTHTINIFNQPVEGGQIPLIDYTGTALTTDQFNRFVLGILPSGLADYQLVNNTSNTSIDLLITLEDQIWKGSTDGNWNASTTNWALASAPGTPVVFSLDNPALFDDTATTYAVTVDAAGVFPLSLTFNNTANAYTFTGGDIGGNASLEKNGSNAVTLAQANSYTGGSIINGGTLRIGSGGTTGDIGSGAVTVASGATLEFNRSNATPGTPDLDYKTNAKLRNVSGAGDIVLTGGVHLFNYTGTGTGFSETNSWNNFSGNLIIKGGSEFMTIRNGATAMGTGDIILGDGSSSGALSQIEGNWTWTNDISLVGSDNRIRNRSLNGPRSLKLQGVVSGSGGLTFEDPAAQMTDVNRGFILTNTNTMNGTLTIAAGVPLRVGGIPGNVDASNPGLLADNSGTLGAATVVNNGTLTFSRKDAHGVSNNISGSGALRVGIPAAASLGDTTTQVLTYTGSATHTGATTVNNGTLLVGPGGSLGGSSVTVASGATIGGIGTVAAPLTVDGTVAPGTSIGTLPVTGNTAVNGTLAIEVDGASVDKLSVTGDLTLNGALTLTETGAGFTAASYVVAECTGTLSGTLTAPPGYTVTLSGSQVILEEAAGYDAWAATNAGGQTANLDFDNDGVSNGVEYFMGETGSSFTPNPTVVTAGAVRTVTWPRDPAAIASFKIQISTTLAPGGWTDVIPPHASIDTSNPNQVTYTLPAGTIQFCRLVVTP